MAAVPLVERVIASICDIYINRINGGVIRAEESLNHSHPASPVTAASRALACAASVSENDLNTCPTIVVIRQLLRVCKLTVFVKSKVFRRLNEQHVSHLFQERIW